MKTVGLILIGFIVGSLAMRNVWQVVDRKDINSQEKAHIKQLSMKLAVTNKNVEFVTGRNVRGNTEVVVWLNDFVEAGTISNIHSQVKNSCDDVLKRYYITYQYKINKDEF